MEQLTKKQIKRRISISLLAILLIGLLAAAAVYGVVTARNLSISSDVRKTHKAIEDKVNGYILIPFSEPAGAEFSEEDFIEFNQNIDEIYECAIDLYKQTVDNYNGILIDAYNFETDGVDPTLCEQFGQDWVIINTNYLDFNPVYAPDGTIITREQLVTQENIFNVIVPISKKDKVAEIVDFRVAGYGEGGLDLGLTEDLVNVVFYDDSKSRIQAYNPLVAGNEGIIESPVLEIWNEQYFGMQTGNALARGYFINAETRGDELRSVIELCGLSNEINQTPTVSDTFEERISSINTFIFLYGSIGLVLLVGAVIVAIIIRKIVMLRAV
ncbi:MAG: hypothetical protein LBL82_07635 [Oscillospiraceae bacterium]|jgi:hypothetical protein|nr:hypothetical protein [Oscillospiraceae bacterium]